MKHNSHGFGNDLVHYGILGMKWGVRRFQEPDGTYTAAGKRRYREDNGSSTKSGLDKYAKRYGTPGKPKDRKERKIQRYHNPDGTFNKRGQKKYGVNAQGQELNLIQKFKNKSVSASEKIKIGASALAISLAAYGAIKSRSLDGGYFGTYTGSLLKGVAYTAKDVRNAVSGGKKVVSKIINAMSKGSLNNFTDFNVSDIITDFPALPR